MTKKKRNLILYISASLVIAGFFIATHIISRRVFGPNVYLHGRRTSYLYIPSRAGFPAVLDSLCRHGYLVHRGWFQWTADRKGYRQRVRPGRYLLRNGMSNNELLNMLRVGKQSPVRLTFQNIRTPQDLAGRVGRQIEADSLSLINLFRDPGQLNRYHVTPATLFTIIIPNTYEFYWNTSAAEFISRMYRESKDFWTPRKKEKASAEHLSILQVVTLASIVEKETSKTDEMPVIAGVYMNRLRRNIPLQADPTLIYAWNDYAIRRVLNKHKEIDSPYNTYLNPGLPPGPICVPSVFAIDAVLDYTHHDYLYFCAKEDFSGYHYFSKSLEEHNRHARNYRIALKKAGIMH
jgi:UPF0755 protein